MRTTCIQCGVTFEGRNNRAKLCSFECQEKRRRERVTTARRADPGRWREYNRRQRARAQVEGKSRKRSPRSRESQTAAKRRERIVRSRMKSAVALNALLDPNFMAITEQRAALKKERRKERQRIYRAQRPYPRKPLTESQKRQQRIADRQRYWFDPVKSRATALAVRLRLYWDNPTRYRDNRRISRLRKKARNMLTRKYHNTTTVDLFALLNDIVDKTEAGIQKAAEIMMELHHRGESHPLMHEGLFKFYEHIAAGQLTPRAAMTFTGCGPILRKLVGLDAALQNNIAAGDPIPLMEMDAKGAAAHRKVPVLRMSQSQLDLAFDGSKLRPTLAQEKLLRAAASRRTATVVGTKDRVRFDTATGHVLISNMRITPFELKDALLALGFRLVRVKNEPHE